MTGRLMRLGVVLAVSLASLAGSATPASAAFSNTPDTTWMTNGVVYAMTQSGGRIYVGGKFRSLRRCPPGATCAGGTIATNVGALDATTGDGIKTFKVTVGGDGATVYALAVANGKLYIGGQFTSVNGEPRMNLAAVDATTGALDPTFAPQVGADSDYVRGMLSHGGLVYVAGKFGTINGAVRQHLAAFNANGSLSGAWRPRTSGIARSFAPTCAGDQIVIGGSFSRGAGTGTANQDRKTLMIVDAATGALDPWTPDNAAIPNGVTAYDLANTCDALFVGYGGSNAIYRFDLTDDFGNIEWDLKTGGNVQTVALYGTQRVMFGGHFANTPVAPGTTTKVKRVRFATADFGGNAFNDWTPEFSGKFFGPWDILVDGTHVWVGGAFTDVSGSAQFMLARFSDI
jgi:Domain of unknown function (DUF5122) beta-propeller